MDPQSEYDHSITEAMGAVSATLLEVLRRLDRIDDRMQHLESLWGNADIELDLPSPQEPDVVPGIGAQWTEDSQSVLQRQWDAVAGQWVYTPETPSAPPSV